MKNIYYVSDNHDEYHPENSSTKFTTSIHPSRLEYLPQGDLEFAVKSITTVGSRNKYQCLALKSTLASSESISSGKWDNILCLFHLEKDQIYTEFNNPTFYPTSKHLLSKATFELIDLETKQQQHQEEERPTVIHIIVKQQPRRMKHPFQIHLDSSCPISKLYFPQNNNMEFTIRLPKRLEFKKNWSVALKSINFPNHFYNVKDCFVVIRRGDYVIEQRIADGYYSSTEHFVDELNKTLDGISAFTMGVDQYEGYVFLNLLIQNTRVSFNRNLGNLLKLPAKMNTTSVRSTGVINLNENVPKHVIVSCNIVENSIVGDKQLPVIKVLTLSEEKVLNFDFTYNDYLQMNLKDFESINIKLMDINGLPLQFDNSIPTRLQMVFINTNSA